MSEGFTTMRAPRFPFRLHVAGALFAVGALLAIWWRATQASVDVVASAEATRPSATTSPARAGTSPRGIVSTPPHRLTLAEKIATLRARFGPDASAEEILRAIDELAGNDTALALDLAHALGRTQAEKSAWVTQVADRWAARAPQEAWDWLGHQDSEQIRALATGTLPEVIIGGIARVNPTLLVHNLDTLVRAGEGPLGIAPVVATHLGLEALIANRQLDLAQRAVETWSTDPSYPAIGEAAYIVVAAAMSQTAADAAGTWLKALPASPERDAALVEFPAQWAQHDTPAAIAWAETQAPSDVRRAALERTFFEWIDRSPADAAEWLGGYLARTPSGSDADRMIAAVVNLGNPLKSDPATALHWADLISDARLRSSAEERIMLRWGRQDRNAAIGYIMNAATLAPARKQALLTQMQSPTFLETDDY